MSREAFDEWMAQPVAEGFDHAPWIDGLASEAAWQTWQARDAEVADLRDQLDQEQEDHRKTIAQLAHAQSCQMSTEIDAKRYRILRQHWFDFGTLLNGNSVLGWLNSALAKAGDVETVDSVLDSYIARATPAPLGGSES